MINVTMVTFYNNQSNLPSLDSSWSVISWKVKHSHYFASCLPTHSGT